MHALVVAARLPAGDEGVTMNVRRWMRLKNTMLASETLLAWSAAQLSTKKAFVCRCTCVRAKPVAKARDTKKKVQEYQGGVAF